MHCVGAQEFSYGHIKFEFLIRHNFFFMLNSPSKLESGGGVFFFFFHNYSLSGTESFHNSLAGTETMVEGRGGFECFV